MRILLTGSGGFIGKNLKLYLQDKFVLLAPRSYELDLINSDEVARYFRNNNIDFVIHCASIGGERGIPDKNTTIEDNLAMVDSILSAKDSDTRVILFGSGAIYDKSRNLHKISETEIGEIVPHDLYGKSKLLIAEKIRGRTDVLMLNIFACYGYGEKENRFPSYAINQVLKGEDIYINKNVIFDYLFVEDMAKIVDFFITNVSQENIINITPTRSSSLLEIANVVKSFSEKNIDINILNPLMNNEYTGSNSLLLKNYTKLEFTSLEIGLMKLFEYNKTMLTEV